MEDAAYERIRVAAILQTKMQTLVADRPQVDRELSRILLEMALAVALNGTDEVSKQIAKIVGKWWQDRVDATGREMTRRIWHEVNSASCSLKPNDARGASKSHTSMRGPSAFELAAKKLHISVGTASRIYYAELKRRSEAGGWIPLKRGKRMTKAKRAKK